MSTSTSVWAVRYHRSLEEQGLDSRFAAVQKRSNIQKVQVSKYLGPVPCNVKLMELFVALPGLDFACGFIDKNDPATQATFAQVQTSCKVWIEIDTEFVTLYGETQLSLQNAYTAIRNFLETSRMSVQGKMIPLIHRSAAPEDEKELPIVLKSLVQFNKSWRPVIDVTSGSDDSPLHVTDFNDAIHKAAGGIRPRDGEMRARVNLGIFTITQRQTNRDQYTTNKEFKSFLEKLARRGTSYVSHRLGDETFARRVLDLIYQTDGPNAKFTGSGATIISLRETKPHYCLVLFSKSLLIEVDVQYDLQYGVPSPVAPRAFSLARRDKVVEVAVSCPERKFDWQLSVMADCSKDIPQEIHRLVNHGLAFRQPIPDSHEFPITHMNFDLIRAASIDKVACKVSWPFDYAETPYRLEVSIYHDWESPEFFTEPNSRYKGSRSLMLDTAAGTPAPTKSCGIVLYGLDWDEGLRHLNTAQQSNYADSFTNLFTGDALASGIDELLMEIQYLHKLTELAGVKTGCMPDGHENTIEMKTRFPTPRV